MPKTVEPEIFLLQKPSMDTYEAKRWLRHLGVSEDAITRNLEDGDISDGERVIGLAAKRCYNSFEPGLNPNVNRVRTEWVEYLDNVMTKKHGSVLCHSNWTFAFEGTTRVLHAELNRHAAGTAISQESQRYVRLTNIQFWMPDCIRPDSAWKKALGVVGPLTDAQYKVPISLDEYTAAGGSEEAYAFESKKLRTRNVFFYAFQSIQKYYDQLQEIWKEELTPKSKFSMKKVITSMFRRIVPIGICTGGVYTFNGRAIRHILTMRCAPGAEEEICMVMTTILKRMIEETPALMNDFYQDENGFWRPGHVKV